MTPRKPEPVEVVEADMPSLTPAAQPLVAVNTPLTEIQANIDALLEARRYLLDKVLPLMVEKVDYNVIKGKESLGKPGAEKIAAIWRLNASFAVDRDTLACLPERGGVLAYVCTLTRGAEFVGEGRGARRLEQDRGDINKSIKMAQKSAYVDAVIRATGISDLFTQDLEDMPQPEERGGGNAGDRTRQAETPAAAPSRAAERTQAARDNFNQATGRTTAPPVQQPQQGGGTQAALAKAKKEYADLIARISRAASNARQQAENAAKRSDPTQSEKYQALADLLADTSTRAIDAAAKPMDLGQYSRGVEWLTKALAQADETYRGIEQDDLPF